MAGFTDAIKKMFTKIGKSIENSAEYIATSKRHFKPIIKWAASENLKVLKIEDASLSESGFSFFQTSRGYSISKLEVLDESSGAIKGCYVLVTENFGIPDDFETKWVDPNSLHFMNPYIVDYEHPPE